MVIWLAIKIWWHSWRESQNIHNSKKFMYHHIKMIEAWREFQTIMTGERHDSS